MDKQRSINHITSKQSQFKRTNSDTYLPLTGYRTFHPADPLPKRKVIPLKSPKFGKRKNYLILPPFIKQEKITKMEFKTIQREKVDPNQEKQYEIDAYANSSSMLSKLVYCKVKFNNENKITLTNILDLNKRKEDENEEDDDTRDLDHNILPFYALTNEEDATLIFESRFECGNLLCAYKTEETPLITKYQLILENDTNTTGYVQWFFFRITNTKKQRKASFTIINLMRKVSLYNNGLKIWCYSEKKAEKENIGWHRTGDNIMYYQNSYYVYNNDKRRSLYSLSFDYEFLYDDDTVYFANSLPYSYTDLMREMNHYQIEEKKYPYFHRRTICSTLGGNDLDMITINSMPNMNASNYDMRKSIILLARQHPGETCSSYVMKGAIDFLMGNSDEARKLRELYLIKIFPMMNPDGVIVGNSRTSFAGCDINRRWTNPDEIIHPEIFYTKEMVLKMSNQRDIGFVCDFHGHIGAYNAFFYCNHKDNPRSCSLFPYICTKLNKNISYNQSNFKMPKYKNGTGRISLFKDLELDNIVTLETSFFGVYNKNHDEANRVYFNAQLLKEIGRDVCLGMLAYYYKYENRSIERNLRSINVDLKEYEDFIREETEEMESDNNIENHSESEPSIDNFDRKIIMSLLPTRAKRSRKKVTGKTSLNKNILQSSKKSLKENNELKLWMMNKQPKPVMPLMVREPKSQSMPKIISPPPFVKPIVQSPSSINEKELTLSRKEEGTQTEEIFFKMHWSYFAGEYPIKIGKIAPPKNYNKVREQLMLRNKSFISNPLLNSHKNNLKERSANWLRGNNTNTFKRTGFLPKFYHG